MYKKIKVNEIVSRFEGGGFYRIKGDLLNGQKYNEQGKLVPYTCHEDIVRRINLVDIERSRLYCECGREFIINENIEVTPRNY